MIDDLRLPSHWRWATFNDVARVASDLVDPTLTPEAIHIAPNHIESWTGKLLPYRTVAADRVTSPKHRFNVGQILYSKIRPYLAKAALATFEGVCSADMYPVDSSIAPKFLFHWLLSPWFTAQTAQNQGRTILPKINQEALGRLPVPVAPYQEQQRIASKIEELFSDLDAGVAALERIKANLKRYRAAVLKAAVEGKLTEEWRAKHPNTEPASKLLERILAERRKKWGEDQLAKFTAAGKTPPKGWQEKYVEPAAPDISGLPELPKGWCWASPEQLAGSDAYSLAIGPFGSNLKVSDYTNSGIPLVFVRNIRSESFGGEATKYVSEAKAIELKPHQIEAGDVLITKMGEPPGDACLYPHGNPTAIITADCIKFRLANSIHLPTFFVFAINSDLVHRQIVRITKGVAQQKISLASFSTLALPLPPLSEQEQIVAELERQLSLLTAGNSETHTNLQRAARLRQSILKRAFEGKLVPQDPTDEPADKLLERIRQGRNVTNGNAAPRRRRVLASNHKADGIE